MYYRFFVIIYCPCNCSQLLITNLEVGGDLYFEDTVEQDQIDNAIVEDEDDEDDGHD